MAPATDIERRIAACLQEIERERRDIGRWSRQLRQAAREPSPWSKGWDTVMANAPRVAALLLPGLTAAFGRTSWLLWLRRALLGAKVARGLTPALRPLYRAWKQARGSSFFGVR